MKILLTLLLTFYIFPTDIEGLREFKVGEKVPVTGELKALVGKGKSVLLYLKSDDLKSVAFFRQFIKSCNSKKKRGFFLVDVNSETDKRVMTLYEKLKGDKKSFNDPDRKIYGDLGIVVIPSLLFIDEAGMLNSVIVGYRSNLGLFFKDHLQALMKGEKPGDVYKAYNRKLDRRKLNRITSQAFTLLLDGNYELAASMYNKVIKKERANGEANLGYGFSLIMQKKLKEAEGFFVEVLKSEDSKRVRFGLFLSRSLTDPSDDNLDNLSRFALIEPSFFPAVYEAASVLEKNGKNEMSIKIFKRSYRILLRTYRRNK